MKNNNVSRYYLNELVLIILCFLAYYLSSPFGLIKGGDTQNYIDQIPVRTKGFGIYLNSIIYLQTNHKIPDAAFILFHISIAALATWNLVNILTNIRFIRDTASKLILTILVFSPYLQRFLFDEKAYIQNYLMTECLAYPLFILYISQLIKIFYYLIIDRKFEFKEMIVANITLGLLIMIRPQFYFLFFFFIVILVILLLQKSHFSTKNIFYVSISFLTIMLINPTLHYIYHGKSPKPSFVTDQILTNIFFYSKMSDTIAIKDTYSRKRFANILYKIEQDSLNHYSNNIYNNQNYNNICHEILEKDTLIFLSDIQLEAFQSKSTFDLIGSISVNDKVHNWNNNTQNLCKEILSSGYLLSRHLKNYFFHFFSIPVSRKDLQDQKLSYWHLIFFFVVIILFIVLILRSAKPNELVILSLILMIYLSNRALIVLFEPLLHRYTFYTELPALGLLTIFLLNQRFALFSKN